MRTKLVGLCLQWTGKTYMALKMFPQKSNRETNNMIKLGFMAKRNQLILEEPSQEKALGAPKDCLRWQCLAILKILKWWSIHFTSRHRLTVLLKMNQIYKLSAIKLAGKKTTAKSKSPPSTPEVVKTPGARHPTILMMHQCPCRSCPTRTLTQCKR